MTEIEMLKEKIKLLEEKINLLKQIIELKELLNQKNNITYIPYQYPNIQPYSYPTWTYTTGGHQS